jgi:hypothetical protein
MAEEDSTGLRLRYPNLRPIKAGEVRNPTGRNGKARLEEFREYLSEKAEVSSSHTRWGNILRALYATAIDRRRRDHVAAIRVILAYELGLPTQALQLDHSSTDGSMGRSANVVIYLPDNGRGPRPAATGGPGGPAPGDERSLVEKPGRGGDSDG